MPKKELSAAMTARELIRLALAEPIRNLLAVTHALGEGGDSEAVHRARVAVRKIRSYLRTFSPVLNTIWAEGLRERLRWLSDGLSAARDADIIFERTGSLEAFVATRDEAHSHVKEMVQDPRYLAIASELAGALEHLQGNARIEEPARDIMCPLLSRTWKRLCKRARRCHRDPSDAGLHRVRIAAKHMRYAAEAFVPIAGRRADTFAHKLATLQDVLGEEHDAAVTALRLKEVEDMPEMAQSAGTLAARETKAARRARSHWRRAWHAVTTRKRFWQE